MYVINLCIFLLLNFDSICNSLDLVVQPMLGLSNRIRALVSARTVANEWNRRLVIVWKPDVHCKAQYEELFELNKNANEIVTNIDEDYFDDCIIYDYMISSQKNKKIDMNVTSNICFVSAFVAVATKFDYYGKDIRKARKGLRHQFHFLSEPVRNIVNSIYLPPNTIGLHIRSIPMDQDIPGIELVTDNRTNFKAMLPDKLNEIRSGCNWWSFLPSIRKFGAEMNDPVVVVASDSGPTPLGGMIPFEIMDIGVPPECFKAERRSVKCQQYALAVISTLSKVDQFIGSQWSSFTEIIHFMNKKVDLNDAKFGCVRGYEWTWKPIGKGTSIIISTTEYSSHIEETIKCALNTNAAELVLVHWGHKPLLDSSLLSSTKVIVKQVCVEDETSWNLGRAYNLGIKETSNESILMLRSGICLDSDIFGRMSLIPAQKSFKTAHMNLTSSLLDVESFNYGYNHNWESLSQYVLYINRDDFLRSGGFDERLTDDIYAHDEFYGRLDKNGLKLEQMDTTPIKALLSSKYPDVGINIKSNYSAFFRSVQKFRNKYCLNMANHRWEHVVGSYYSKVYKNDTYLSLKTLYAPYNVTLYMKCLTERQSIKHVLGKLFSPLGSQDTTSPCAETYTPAANSLWYSSVYSHHTDGGGIIRLMIDTVKKSTCVYRYSEIKSIAHQCYADWNSDYVTNSCQALVGMCKVNVSLCNFNKSQNMMWIGEGRRRIDASSTVNINTNINNNQIEVTKNENGKKIFRIQINGEPVPKHSCDLFHLNILSGGSNLCSNAFYLPIVLNESSWSYHERYKPMNERSIDVLYRSTNCIGQREKLASMIRKKMDLFGFKFAVAGRCRAGSRHPRINEGPRWHMCQVCKDSKMIIAFENFKPNYTYLSEKPFLAPAYGAVTIYHGNGEELATRLGVNASNWISRSSYETDEAFVDGIIKYLMPSNNYSLVERGLQHPFLDPNTKSLSFDFSQIHNYLKSNPELSSMPIMDPSVTTIPLYIEKIRDKKSIKMFQDIVGAVFDNKRVVLTRSKEQSLVYLSQCCY